MCSTLDGKEANKMNSQVKLHVATTDDVDFYAMLDSEYEKMHSDGRNK